MSARIWFSTTQAGDYIGKHRDTVMKACESGELHGVQRIKKARWRIHADCLDAWARGVACEHKAAEVAA